MKRHRFRRLTTRVIVRMVRVPEAPLRLLFGGFFFFSLGGFLTRFVFRFLTFPPFQNRPCVFGSLSPFSDEFS